MKSIITTILLLVPYMTMAQVFNDSNPICRVVYDYSYKIDSLSKYYYKEEFNLDICKEKSAFYSNDYRIRDSVKHSLLDKKINIYVILDEIKKYPRGLPMSVIKDKKINRLTMYNMISIQAFMSEDVLKLPIWRITSDTMMVGGYICHKAIANFYGRNWVAWYTNQLSINDGPWFLWGLPGLILYAYDSNGYFKFMFKETMLLNKPYSISFYYNPEKIKTLSLKEMVKGEELYYKDDLKFETLFIFDGKEVTGTKAPVRKYIPLIKY